MNRLQSVSVPAEAVIDDGKAFGDPHFRSRGFIEQIDHRECGTHLYPGLGFKPANTPTKIRTASCMMGEHNENVYRQLLGTSFQSYADMERTGHISEEYAQNVR